ncbi:MAG: hypothetical protein GY842_21575 [bacterium]|nr:hypothetical protein [bacterium]
MSTEKREGRRPEQFQPDPGARETTVAASEPIVPGAQVEIDLFGEGVKAGYAALLVRGTIDAEHVIDAADKMVLVLRDLKQARATNHDRHHVDFWSLLIRRLRRVEYHLSQSGVDGAKPLTVLVAEANRTMTIALRDGVELGAAVWDDAESLLASVGVECLALAENVEGTLRGGSGPVSFAPLSEGSCYTNPEALSAGIITAAQLGLDLNELEIGLCAGGDVARVIRGKVL